MSTNTYFWIFPTNTQAGFRTQTNLKKDDAFGGSDGLAGGLLDNPDVEFIDLDRRERVYP